MYKDGKFYNKLGIPEGAEFPDEGFVADGDLFYNTTVNLPFALVGGTWQNIAQSGVGGSGATELDELTDVTITSPAGGNVIHYDPGVPGWVNVIPSGYNAASILAALLTVDGTTSGLDADMVDGRHASYTPAAYQIPVVDGNSEIILPGRIQLASITGTATNGYLWQDSTQKALQTFVDGIEQTLVGCIFTQTANKTVVNTGTATSIFGTGVGMLTLPANFWVAGKTVKIVLNGYYSTTSNPSLFDLIPKLGASTLAYATGDTTASITNQGWSAEFVLTCRTAGSSGTIMTQGWLHLALTPSSGVRWSTNITTTVTVNTTGALVLDVLADWGTAHASNSFTSTNAFVTILN